jgi:hypothetical protein
MAAQIEAVLYVPVADNEGMAFGDTDWMELHARLARVGNGATRRGPHMGSWTAPDGVLYTEPVFEFEVAIDSWFAVQGFLETVRWTQSYFRQIAIHFKVAGIHETFPA